MRRSSQLRAVVLGSLFALVFGSVNLFAITTWIIKGKVTDAKTGTAIVGAEIALKSLSNNNVYKVKTNKNGEYLYRLPWDSYRLTCKMEHYIPKEEPMVKPSGEAGGDEVTKDFAMQPGEGRLASEMTKEELEQATKDNEKAMAQEAENKKRAANVGQVKQLLEDALKDKASGSWAPAIQKLEQAMALDEKQPSVVGNLAECYVGKGDFDKGIELYKKALEMVGAQKPAPNAGDLAALHTQLGNAYLKKGMQAEAMSEFDQVVKADPKNADLAYYNIGITKYNAGNMDEAAIFLGRAVEAKPSNSLARYFLAMCLVNKADYKGAVTHMEEYLKIDPNGPKAAEIKGMLPMLKDAAK